MAGKIWRHGCGADDTDEGAGGRECPAQEDVRRGAPEGRRPERSHRKKVVKPSHRREMAMRAVRDRSLTVKAACAAFGVGETCYRYRAKATSPRIQ